MTKPFVDIFGYLAEDNVAQAVIKGTFQEPSDTPKYVLEFLETLVMPDAIRELGLVDLKKSCEENRTGRKKMKSDEVWQTTRLDQANPTGEERIFERCTAYNTTTAKN